MLRRSAHFKHPSVHARWDAVTLATGECHLPARWLHESLRKHVVQRERESAVKLGEAHGLGISQIGSTTKKKFLMVLYHNVNCQRDHSLANQESIEKRNAQHGVGQRAKMKQKLTCL